jgi:hypothetical protein
MSNYLEKFRSSAAAMRSPVNPFPGTFIAFSYSTGEFTAGKNKTDMHGRRLVALTLDLIATWRRYSDSDRQFYYAGAGFVRDGWVLSESSRPQPDREDLKWVPTWILILADPETHEQYVLALSSITGKEDALSALQTAFVDHNEGQDQAFCEVPIIELTSESYLTSQGKKNFKPLLDVVGWSAAPPWIRPPKLPPETIQKDEPGPKPEEVIPY